MAKVLNTHEQADFERLAAFYPYRDEHGLQERIRFIWNNEARTLKNWHHDTGKYGRTITGWDEDKNNIRTFYRDDIDRFLEIRTRRINQDSTKRVPMFVKLRTARYRCP